MDEQLNLQCYSRFINSIRELFSLSDTLNGLKDFGYDIDYSLKDLICKKSGTSTSDISFNIQPQLIYDNICDKVREKLSTELKPFGFSKCAKSTCYNIVVCETKRNCRLYADLSTVRSFISRLDDYIPSAERRHNQEVNQRFNEFINVYQRRNSFDISSSINRVRYKYIYLAWGDGNTYQIGYSFKKIKLANYFSIDPNRDRMIDFLNHVKTYVALKEFLLNNYIHVNGDKVRLFDIVTISPDYEPNILRLSDLNTGVEENE